MNEMDADVAGGEKGTWGRGLFCLTSLQLVRTGAQLGTLQTVTVTYRQLVVIVVITYQIECPCLGSSAGLSPAPLIPHRKLVALIRGTWYTSTNLTRCNLRTRTR